MFWMGIDIGSISTDFVVIDEEGNVASSLYIKTQSQPVEAIKKGIFALGKEYSDRDIEGVGLTGSGRNLGAAIVGGDVVKNEITAHARAVIQSDDNVQTVIEIGGQDSKLILLENGFVKDFAMNTVCAAGTGSFLDRQAERMGITIEELSNMAVQAEREISIAGRCAVFAETDLIHKQQIGADRNQLMAGLCKALATSYLTNVARGKSLREKIYFQGGVASNNGMRKAFEELLGCKVFVPEHHKIMGAVGAAYLAQENKRGKTLFKGFNQCGGDISFEEITCDNCENKCRVVRVVMDNHNHGYFGDMCGKYSGIRAN